MSTSRRKSDLITVRAVASGFDGQFRRQTGDIFTVTREAFEASRADGRGPWYEEHVVEDESEAEASDDE